MNSTLTLKLSTVPAAAKTNTAAPLLRTLARKWDMLAVIGLMVSSAAYGVFALAPVA